MKKLVISTLFVMQVLFVFAQTTTGITGKVVDSKPSINGKLVPAGAGAVTVKAEVALLFVPLPSTPLLGADTETEKVCAAVDNPVKLFKGTFTVANDANEPVQVYVWVEPPSIL